MEHTPAYIPASVLGGASAAPVTREKAPKEECPPSPISPRLQRLFISAMVTIIATALWTAIIPEAKPARTELHQPAAGASRATSSEPPAAVTPSERAPDMIFTLPDDDAPAKAKPKRPARAARAKKIGRIRPNPY